MRRFLQFLFTVALGAALLYLFAGKHRPRKADPHETPSGKATDAATGE